MSGESPLSFRASGLGALDMWPSLGIRGGKYNSLASQCSADDTFELERGSPGFRGELDSGRGEFEGGCPRKIPNLFSFQIFSFIPCVNSNMLRFYITHMALVQHTMFSSDF